MKKIDIENSNNVRSLASLRFYLIWLLIIALVGIIVGSVTAFFLISLDWVTDYREQHLWIIALLPLGGLLIGLMYHHWGNSVVKGNNLLIEEFHKPNQVIPFKMAPLVYFGTIITHWFGGSAGREGTAVQMGAAIADQFSLLFQTKAIDRKILIVIGISAGFSAVFGTPWAGAVFALEVLILEKTRYIAIIPSILVAFIAHFTCLAWSVSHTEYSIPFVPTFTFELLLWCIVAGILFGLTAWLFANSTRLFAALFQKIKYAPWRPLLGGIIIALLVWLIGNTKHIGLGIPTIVASFIEPQNNYDFAIKIMLTALTIGSGFKGGEVTPLFFIGATLGNALIWFVPLPMALLAGMGFVAVFSGATNTPIACTIMAMELFGTQSLIYMGIACGVAYLFSGPKGIYSAQPQNSFKHHVYNKIISKINRPKI